MEECLISSEDLQGFWQGNIYSQSWNVCSTLLKGWIYIILELNMRWICFYMYCVKKQKRIKKDKENDIIQQQLVPVC